jgi:hypothetical protein
MRCFGYKERTALTLVNSAAVRREASSILNFVFAYRTANISAGTVLVIKITARLRV